MPTATSVRFSAYYFIDEPKKNLKLPNPANAQLMYRCPARFLQVPIPFEFKDLPLP